MKKDSTDNLYPSYQTPHSNQSTNLDVTPSTRHNSFYNSLYLQNIVPAPCSQLSQVQTPIRNQSLYMPQLQPDYYSSQKKNSSLSATERALQEKVKEQEQIMSQQQQHFNSQIQSQQKAISVLQENVQRLLETTEQLTVQNQVLKSIKASPARKPPTSKLSCSLKKQRAHQISMSRAYLDERHKQTVQKIQQKRSQQSLQELEEVQDKPSISKYSSMEGRREHSYIDQQLQKNNGRLMQRQQEIILEEQGCTFKPQISESSRSIRRRVQDLYDWKEGRDEFLSAYRFVKDLEEEKMSSTQKICSGSMMILEDKRSSAHKERSGKKIEDRLYVMNSERKSRLQKSRDRQELEMQLKRQPLITKMAQHSPAKYLLPKKQNNSCQGRQDQSYKQPMKKKKIKKLVQFKKENLQPVQSKDTMIRKKLTEFIKAKYDSKPLIVQFQNKRQDESFGAPLHQSLQTNDDKNTLSSQEAYSQQQEQISQFYNKIKNSFESQPGQFNQFVNSSQEMPNQYQTPYWINPLQLQMMIQQNQQQIQMIAPQLIHTFAKQNSTSPRADSQTKLSHFLSSKSSSHKGFRCQSNLEDEDLELSNEENSDGS